jgi:hypothetical protein
MLLQVQPFSTLFSFTLSSAEQCCNSSIVFSRSIKKLRAYNSFYYSIVILEGLTSIQAISLPLYITPICLQKSYQSFGPQMGSYQAMYVKKPTLGKLLFKEFSQFRQLSLLLHLPQQQQEDPW